MLALSKTGREHPGFNPDDSDIPPGEPLRAGRITIMGVEGSSNEASASTNGSHIGQGPTGTPRMSGLTSVAVIDDHALVRAGTRQILEADGRFKVVCDFADPTEALTAIASEKPDVALVDVALGGQSGIELAKEIRKLSPETAVVMLSAYDDENYLAAALAVGAKGYLLKTAPAEELLQAVDAASRGTTVLDPQVTAKLTELSSRKDPLRDLTARELDVMAYLAHGCPNKVIAFELGISLRTVEGHIGHIFEKTGTTSRTELALMAARAGLGSRVNMEGISSPTGSQVTEGTLAQDKGS